MVWIVLLSIVIIVLICMLILVYVEVSNINKQIEYMLEHDTNKMIQLAHKSKHFKLLGHNIQKIIEQCKTTEIHEKQINYKLKEDITNLSHDIRTPLTSINGYFELLNASEDKQEREKYELIIKDRVESLSDMLEQMFTYTKLQNNTYSFELKYENVSEILSKTMFSFYDAIKQRGIEPKLYIPDDDIYALSNREVLQRVFHNIIKNAIRYGNGSICVKIKENTENVRILFENECDCVDSIDTKRVFERFYRADEARKSGATGLGLYIVKELLSQTKGEVEAKVCDNKFIITISLSKQ